MKKIISIAIIAVLALAFVGCGGSDSPYVGKWKVTAVEMQKGQETPWNEKTYGEVVMTVKGDKTMSLVTKGKDDGTGTWEEKDGKLIVTDKSNKSTKLKGELKGKKIYLEIQGMTFIFEKK